ncbi:PAS domain S-box protein [Paeniroseomonas aquatica]|uniref:histidine kinase n=1 Tax=Paeniroseomonas aquatica TaxID=373043 RepID=A0ABT8AAL9_9PROT|nr:PAS domain S-box protein [Paeniroseomonas aquatica]MDN3566796.1 PAS domain S-box protein [Paeniroseomonas aquatica]
MNETDHAELLRQQTVLARFGEFAIKSDDLDGILTEACSLIGGALGTDLAKVMELREDGETLFVRAGVGWKPGVVGEATVKASDHTSEGHALKTGRPMISPDIAEERRFSYPPFLTENGVKAVANVPIIGKEGEPPFGILQIDSREPRRFTDADTAFLRTYANLISAAMDRLRATEDLRDREARLRRSEERFRRVSEIETVGVIFFDTEGRITDGNAAFLRMSGFTREDVEARRLRWDRLTPPEWMAQTLACLEELKATGQGTPFEKEYFRKDGSRWWGLFAGRMLDDGTAVELVLDITTRKAAEQATRDSEARLRSLVEGIPQLVFRSRSSGERIWGSPQWLDYAGQSETESVGLGWLDAIHPGDRAATLAAWGAAEARGLFAVEHRTFRAADRSWRWFQSRATPVRDAGGRILEWFGTSTDIDDQVRARELLARGHEQLEAQVAARTAELEEALATLQTEMAQRERAEAALRQAQKMDAVGQLTGGIAHDFNNMLQGIGGSLDMVRRRIADGRIDEVQRYLDPARQAVERAAGLTRRLLAFARRQRLDPKPLDSDALVAGLADLIRRTVGPAVRLELHLRDGKARVLCDPGELESALLNLCINARDAMTEGGRLVIDTADVRLQATEAGGPEDAAPGDYVAITVTDTGRGMPAGVLERAFEPFFTTKPLGQGTGLGLSQVYGFVRQSGGVVQLESTPGKGTSVRLCLPQHQQRGPVDSPAAAEAPRTAGIDQTVLLVDDDDTGRQASAERLRELGYRVLEAVDGPAAMHLLEGGVRVDMLVTDVGLPNGMNGRQVAEAVQERRPGIPLLFITGYAGTELPPGSEVIDKPFALDTLARRVQAALARR